MISRSTLLILSLLFVSINMLFAQETELIPNKILLTKNGLDASAICVSAKSRGSFDGIFKYGEQLLIDFEDLDGFTKVENKYYPNIDITLLSKKGDTIRHRTNLYGLDQEVIGMYGTLLKLPILPYYPLLLTEGIYTGKEYTLLCTVRDTKSDNKLQMKMDFKVSPNPNPHLTIKKKGLSYSEAYLYSSKNETILIDNTIHKNEALLLTLKDIDGYSVKDDRATFALDFTYTDESGNIILEEQKQLTSGCKDDKVIEPNITLPIRLFEIENIQPGQTVILNLKISDKNSDHLYDISTKLFIEE